MKDKRRVGDSSVDVTQLIHITEQKKKKIFFGGVKKRKVNGIDVKLVYIIKSMFFVCFFFLF